jgi:hypothetical protein
MAVPSAMTVLILDGLILSRDLSQPLPIRSVGAGAEGMNLYYVSTASSLHLESWEAQTAQSSMNSPP